jgi:hypothetical protein
MRSPLARSVLCRTHQHISQIVVAEFPIGPAFEATKFAVFGPLDLLEDPRCGRAKVFEGDLCM